MLVNLKDSDTELPTYDVSIFGAGASGTILALELEKLGVKVGLFESGNFTFNQNTQDMYKGVVAGNFKHAPIDSYRLRFFGGSTNCWGGACLPFDRVDFTPRSYLPDSGWPISFEDLQPYYFKATRYLGLRSNDRFDGSYGEVIKGIEKTGIFKTKYWKVNKKTPRFLEIYGDFFKSKSKTDLYLNANLHSFSTPNHRGVIDSVFIKREQGELVRVKSKYYVLSLGGLENARLLLSSPNLFSFGSAKSVYSNVGKFYSPHINSTHGTFIPSPGVMMRSDEEFIGSSVKLRRFLSLSNTALNKYELLNCKTTFERTDSSAANLSSEVYEYLSNNNLLKSINRYDGIVDEYNSNIDNLIPYKYASLLKLKRQNTFVLNTAFEQAPYINSKVELISDVDQIGLKRIKLIHSVRDEDIKRCIRYFEILAKNLGLLSLGRLSFDRSGNEFIDQLLGASHHTGTTRMSKNIDRGVVDTNCKIHNLSNLYIAGASVFPTPSHANPTFTIIALTIRLAEHIRNLTLTEIKI